MKMLVTGVQRVQGHSDKTGNDYDFAECFVLTPVEIKASEKRQTSGFGFEVAKLSMLPECVPNFSRCSFPCELDLTTDNVMKFGKLETVITGFKPA